MRVVIAGCRHIDSSYIVDAAIRGSGLEITKIISGGARGIDTVAKEWATRNKISFEEYKADWDKYGKRAGPIRNRKMAENADALIAIWDGKSRGTGNMIETAYELGLKVFVFEV